MEQENNEEAETPVKALPESNLEQTRRKQRGSGGT